MLGILKAAGSKPRLREEGKWINGEWTYIESIFPACHARALDRATIGGLTGVSFDQFIYMDTCFKALSARALADRKNELSGAIDRVALSTPKMDTSDWKPLPGSNPRPKN
jgi:hypothetical protein